MPSTRALSVPLLFTLLAMLLAPGCGGDAPLDGGPRVDAGAGADTGPIDPVDAGDRDAGDHDAGIVDAGGADAGPGVGDWTAITVARVTSPITVDGEVVAARGRADEWLAIFAPTDVPEAVAWVAGVGFSGTLPLRGPEVSRLAVAVDPDNRDVYVAFAVRAGDGLDPMTIELSGPDGSVGATTRTFADVDLGLVYTEAFLAKLDADGDPVWLKRLAQGDGGAECTSAAPFAVNAEGDRLMVALNTTNLDTLTSGTAPLTLGPGDPDETIVDVPTNHRVNVTMLLDPETGALEDHTVLGDRTTNYGGVNQGWSRPSAAMIYDEVGARYGTAGGISNAAATNAAFALETDAPVAVPQPGPVGYRAIWGVYAATDLAVGFAQAAAGNTASDGATFTYPLADGQVLVAGQLASTSNATFSSASGNQVFAGGQDDTGWLALYDADDELVWAKPALAGGQSALLLWRSAVDDPEDDAVFAWGLVINSGGVTLGDGEDGEVTFDGLSSGASHGVLARFDRATGELVWARLLQEVSSSRDIGLSGTLFRGTDDTLELRYVASGELSVAGRAEDFGIGISYARTVFAEDGALVRIDTLLHPTDGDGLRWVNTDLAP